MSTQKDLDQTPQQNIPSPNGEERNSGLTRRQFLGRSAAAAFGMPLLAACTIPYPTEVPAAQVVADTAAITESPPAYTPLQFINTEPGYVSQPAYVSSANGKLNIKMEMTHMLQECYIKQENDEYIKDEADIGVIVVNDTPLENLKKQYPCPTLRVKVGDEVAISMVNNFAYSHEEEGEHDPNKTNMHYHGSHLPTGSPLLDPNHPDNYADNIFAVIEQGGTREYNFTINNQQPKGTHWYHSHYHGNTGLHVVNGMAGALIVEDDFHFEEFGDNQPKDIVLVFQQIAQHSFGGIDHVNHPTVHIWINGEENPTIKMQPGEIQRWRIVNATMKAETIGQIISEHMVGLTIRQIAQDGVQFHDSQLNSDDHVPIISFFPGNRVDYLVQAPTEPDGSSWVEQIVLRFSEVNAMGMGIGTYDTKPLLKIDYEPVDGSPDLGEFVDLETTSLTNSNEFPEFLMPIPDSDLETTQEEQDSGLPAGRRRRALVYGLVFQEDGIKFMIDGQDFDDSTSDPSHCMVLDDAEEWTIYNVNPFAHPFHIHVNPFFVTDIYDPINTFQREEYDENDPSTHTFHPMRWMDTVLLPSAPPVEEGNEAEGFNPAYVIVRHKFIDFTGDFVNHCHFLDHEDEGMMQKLRVAGSRDNEAEFIAETGWESKTTFAADPAAEVFGDLEALAGTTPKWS